MTRQSAQDGNSGEGVILVVPRVNGAGDAAVTMEEAVALVESAGAELYAVVTAPLRKPNPRYFVGAGKVQELAFLVADQLPEAVVFDCTLTPIQERNLAQALCCRVLDRASLILDIFAQRARSYEGKLQVEMAQLSRLATRLVRGNVRRFVQ